MKKTCNNMTFNLTLPHTQGELDLELVSVFEERSHFRRKYTLPFNTLVAVLDDGKKDDAVMENMLTQEKYIRKKNDIYFTPVNLPVCYSNTPSLHFIAIHFHYYILPAWDLFHSRKEWILRHDPQMVKKIEKAFRIQDHYQALSAVKECCLAFCNLYWQKMDKKDILKAEKFRPVLEYISQKADGKTTIKELARIMGKRCECFSREFSRFFHCSPSNFLQDELIRKSIFLLVEKGYSVKETAAKLNFSDEFYFSKFFKRRTSCPPSRFKKEKEMIR